MITLGVDDLEKSLNFYRDGLGLHTKGIVGREFGHGAVAFYDLDSGLKLAVWPRESLEHEDEVIESPPTPTEITLGHNVHSKEEVDEVMEQATFAGATVIKAAAETFWGGYSGSFQDPDGHLWEVVWNPHLR